MRRIFLLPVIVMVAAVVTVIENTAFAASGGMFLFGPNGEVRIESAVERTNTGVSVSDEGAKFPDKPLKTIMMVALDDEVVGKKRAFNPFLLLVAVMVVFMVVSNVCFAFVSRGVVVDYVTALAVAIPVFAAAFVTAFAVAAAVFAAAAFATLAYLAAADNNPGKYYVACTAFYVATAASVVLFFTV